MAQSKGEASNLNDQSREVRQAILDGSFNEFSLVELYQVIRILIARERELKDEIEQLQKRNSQLNERNSDLVDKIIYLEEENRLLFHQAYYDEDEDEDEYEDEDEDDDELDDEDV